MHLEEISPERPVAFSLIAVNDKTTPDDFRCRCRGDGNLVSYPVNISTISENAYWSSNTVGPVQLLSLNASGFLVLIPETAHPLATGSYHAHDDDGTIVHRATLDADGIFRLYLHNYSVMSPSSKGVDCLVQFA
ncbi:hypothetical protein GBA52_028497 [Prunus armeniaca]|nr:hypothetical protein GBA52_028497 [Prunus armeniaca]